MSDLQEKVNLDAPDILIGKDRVNSQHAATEKEQCALMARKYGWSLVGVVETGNPILKVICHFSGKSEFPHCHPEQLESQECDDAEEVDYIQSGEKATRMGKT